MLRSKLPRVLLFVVPLILLALSWNAARQRPRFVATPGAATPGAAMSLALSGDGRAIAAALDDGKFAWRESGGWNALPTTNAPTPNSSLPTLQFSPDHQSLLGTNIFVTARNRSLAYAWDLKTNKAAWDEATEDYQGIGNRFVFSADGQKLALLSYNIVKVFDVAGTPANGKNQTFPTLMRAEIVQPLIERGQSTFRPGNPLLSAIALSADGETLVVADHLEQLQFWDATAGRLISRSTPAPYAINRALRVSPDGKFVAARDFKGVVIWDVTARKWTHMDDNTSFALHDVAWMPDSKSLWLGTHAPLVNGNENDRVRQLSVPDLKTLRTLPTVGPVAVSGDGKTLATRADTIDKGVWLWNID